MRLEGWATTTVYPTLRDGPAGFLRVRLGLYQHVYEASTRRWRASCIATGKPPACFGGGTFMTFTIVARCSRSGQVGIGNRDLTRSVSGSTATVFAAMPARP